MTDRRRLEHILAAIDEITRYAAAGRAAFDQNELIQSWIIHRVLVIGEAAAQLSEAFRKKYPATPFRQIIGMRNLLIHQYHQIDLNAVWSVVEQDLTPLRADVIAMLAAEPKS
jgi:uncharacterized protein with HEPN domain